MKIYQVDAFSSKLFEGNAAAVVILEEWLDEQLMQNISNENNLAETSFAKKINESEYEIRWFSPIKEVQFCGYGTLATSFIIFKENLELNTLTFHVKGLGQFYIRKNTNGFITMNLPIQPPILVKDIPNELILALNQDLENLAVYSNDQAYIVVYPTPESVISETPDFERIKKLGGKRVAITSLNDFKIQRFGDVDIISRYFTPSMGINEDPVTGSLHTTLIPLWKPFINKKTITAYQASERGGILYCELIDDSRIEISGQCHLYMQGELII